MAKRERLAPLALGSSMASTAAQEMRSTPLTLGANPHTSCPWTYKSSRSTPRGSDRASCPTFRKIVRLPRFKSLTGMRAQSCAISSRKVSSYNGDTRLMVDAVTAGTGLSDNSQVMLVC
jgi:hypothetical protein